MKKNLIIKMFRDLRMNAVQFASIFVMCLLSMFLLASFDADVEGRLKSTDSYYEATNFMDLCLISEGFTQEDVNDLENIPEIEHADRRTSLTGKITNRFNKKIDLNFIESNNVCRLYCLQGESFVPGKRGLWIDWYFANANGISVGDSLEIECNGKNFTEPVNGIIADSEHFQYIIDESFANPAYKEYCYAFLDSSEYPFEEITFEKILIDLKTVENQMDLDDKDMENLRNAKLKILDSISKSTLRIIMKNEQEGYLSQMSDCMFDQTMIKLFPPLFIILAVLCTITTMARLTAKQRTVIGTLKALGFSKTTVILHYNMYSVVISATGSLIGTYAGIYVLGAWLFEDYEDLYTSPIRHMETSYMVPLTVVLIVLLTGFSNYISCRKLLVLNASEILKPEAPKVSKSGRFEKTVIWRKLSFATRWNLRDMNINRGRTIMGSVGVALCSSLLMGSFGIMECFSMQENWIYRQLRPAQYTINMSEESSYSQAYDYAKQFNGQMVMISNAEISSTVNSRLLYLTVTDDGNLYRFQDGNGEYVDVPDHGALLTARAGRMLNVGKGDTISFRLPSQKKEFSINIVGIVTSPDTQGIVLSRSCYERLGGSFEPSSVYTNMSVPKTYETTRKDIGGVIPLKDYISAYRKSTAGDNDMVYIIVVIGIIVGFVSMLNMGILSFIEKTRDVATLKVLGFQSKRIRWILQQQNLFITGLGALAGLPFGLMYIDMLMDQIDPSGDFLLKLSLVPYLEAIFFSFVVSVIVNGLISTRVNTINMVEALKGVE